MLRFILLLTFLRGFAPVFAQTGYTLYATGDTSDFVTTAHQPGLVLAGGGTDNDSAMVWMLRRAAGGDVVVLRASGSDGYNSYFFSELGVPVHSVETIRFDNGTPANDPFVLRKIRNAEVLFFAGGDQHKYYSYWKDTPVEDAINYLINDKKITVGGTSAGMAILGEAYYVPPGSSLTTVQALGNPYHENINILGYGGFVDAPFMKNLITDTHYDQRNRQGRHVTFMARLTHDYDIRAYGIASNEHVAVCIDGNGLAWTFGDDNATDEYAYFLRGNCQPDADPETCVANTPLTWNRQQAAVQAYKMPGSMQPVHSFDLKDWQTASGGNWGNWSVNQGILLKTANPDGDCDLLSSSVPLLTAAEGFRIFPNPAQQTFQIRSERDETVHIALRDAFGRVIWEAGAVSTNTNIDVPGTLPQGVYYCLVRQGERKSVLRLVFL